MIKYKGESCLKIEQYCIENNFSVEALCRHYGIERRYYTCWKMQLNELPDGVVSNRHKLWSIWLVAA